MRASNFSAVSSFGFCGTSSPRNAFAKIDCVSLSTRPRAFPTRAASLLFGLHRPGWALAEILVLLTAILATIRVFWRVDRPAGLLLLPYAAWVAFATVLNWTIWRMN